MASTESNVPSLPISTLLGRVLTTVNTTDLPTANSTLKDISYAITSALMASSSNTTEVTSFDVQTKRLVLAVITVVLIVVAIGGNAIVICAILRTPFLKRLNNYLIISLALADLGNATFCMPFFVMELVNNYHWPLPQIICALYAGTEISFGLLSVFNLAAISCERVFLITMPMVYQRVVTETRLVTFIIILWIISFTYGLLQMLWFYTDEYLMWSKLNPSMCRYLPSQGFAIFAFMLAFVLPLGIMSGAYLKIFCVVQGQMKRIKPRLSSHLDDLVSENISNIKAHCHLDQTLPSDRTNNGESLKNTEALPESDKHLDNVERTHDRQDLCTNGNITIGHDAFQVLVDQPTEHDCLHAATEIPINASKENPSIIIVDSEQLLEKPSVRPEGIKDNNNSEDETDPGAKVKEVIVDATDIHSRGFPQLQDSCIGFAADDPVPQNMNSLVNEAAIDNQTEKGNIEPAADMLQSKLHESQELTIDANNGRNNTDRPHQDPDSTTVEEGTYQSEQQKKGLNTEEYINNQRTDLFQENINEGQVSGVSIDILVSQSNVLRDCSLKNPSGSITNSNDFGEGARGMGDIWRGEKEMMRNSTSNVEDTICTPSGLSREDGLNEQVKDTAEKDHAQEEKIDLRLVESRDKNLEDTNYAHESQDKEQVESRNTPESNRTSKGEEDTHRFVDYQEVQHLGTENFSYIEVNLTNDSGGYSSLLSQSGTSEISVEVLQKSPLVEGKDLFGEKHLYVKRTEEAGSNVGRNCSTECLLTESQSNTSGNSLKNTNGNIQTKGNCVTKMITEFPLLDKLQSVKQYPLKLQSVLKKKSPNQNEDSSLHMKRNSVQFRSYKDIITEPGSHGEEPARMVLIDDEMTGSSEDNTAETSLSGTNNQRRQSVKEDGNLPDMPCQRHTLEWAKRHFNVQESAVNANGNRYGRVGSLTNSEGEVSKSSKIRRGLVENKAVKMTSYVIGAFVICWVPYQICMMLRLFNPHLVPDILWNVTTVVMFTSTAINPFIYNFYSSQFRAATKRLLFRCSANSISPE